MWSVNERESYPVSLCTTCGRHRCFKCLKAAREGKSCYSASLSFCSECPKQKCFKCSKIAVGGTQCQICPGCTPSKRLRCMKCRNSINYNPSHAIYCQGCSIKFEGVCALCGYVLDGLKGLKGIKVES